MTATAKQVAEDQDVVATRKAYEKACDADAKASAKARENPDDTSAAKACNAAGRAKSEAFDAYREAEDAARVYIEEGGDNE